METALDWLLESGEPWTRYRTLVDLLDSPEADFRVQAARAEMLVAPQVMDLIASAEGWGERALKRHNDASHPIYALSTLADFGLRADDPGMDLVIEKVMAHQSPEGPFQTQVFIPKAFGGPNEDIWSWVACDAPTVLYALLGLGLGEDVRVKAALAHLVGLAKDNGYRCVAAEELARFKGPGKRQDPCPIANVYALKALSLAPEEHRSPAAHQAVEMLLDHWDRQTEGKYFLFGIGTDFRKIKYPLVWYDILHVTEVLSRFQIVHSDPRFQDMLAALTAQADGQGRYTAASMYRAWKGWSFANKKEPSPWLTYLVLRIQKRVG